MIGRQRRRNDWEFDRRRQRGIFGLKGVRATVAYHDAFIGEYHAVPTAAAIDLVISPWR
jgi:hypothetical protein